VPAPWDANFTAFHRVCRTLTLILFLPFSVFFVFSVVNILPRRGRVKAIVAHPHPTLPDGGTSSPIKGEVIRKIIG